MPHNLHKDHRLIDACEQYRVRERHLFGLARMRDLEQSNDIDLLVTFERDGFEGAFEQFTGFKETLERNLGKPVDLITDKPFQNPLFREELEATKKLIYAA